MEALVYGSILGLAGLIPGLHYALVLLAAGPWLLQQCGLLMGLLALVWAVCVARAMHTLTVVYHPVAADQLASADPAQRLRAGGQGKYATRIMGESLWIGGVTVVILVGSMSMLSMIFHKDLIKGLLQNLGFIAIPAFVAWFGFMVWNAGNKGSTLFVFIASGILGVIALEHPSVRGSAQAMTPLLSGLFGLPILLSTLIEKRGKRVVTVEPVSERAHPEIITWMGMSFGLLSVALPGLGTSSLVSVGQNLTKDDAQYLRMSSLAESIGELIALTLGILMIADRSSDAAVISRIVTAFTGEYSLTPTFTWAMLATLISATWVGLRLVPVLGIPYRFLMYVIPNKVQSIAVAVGMLWVVWSHTGSWGLGITAAGTMIHFGARQLGVPNQAFFACMVIPMCLSMFEIRVW